ncbi:peptidyl-prolyl cis-trans isomerase D [Allopseudospirillum japonicum]|uniref:Periplasmic chaperone PpiD n=1 Tax=Allopseudospirillum japonicum TaxID=64971 RepID=A0A1H6S3D9_9GAMM|nr:SurA N-terminal domain-containing protein [Allopseudospirillum japonicum]SEI60384.1 peptidyl-prolyl cis-trans isomerase D [Allopseudospirillum japonicum]
MLDFIRNHSQGWIAKVIVGLIVLTFSLWGVESIIGAFTQSRDTLAQVGDQEISRTQVDNLAQQELRRLLQTNPNIDPETLDQNLLRGMALNRLIMQGVLNYQAQVQDIRISRQAVEREIVRTPQFADAEGRFQQEIYKDVLARAGLTPTGFRAQLSEEILNEHLLGGVSLSAFVLPKERQALEALLDQKRTYRSVRLSLDEYAQDLTPTEEALRTYYQEHQEAYAMPERVQVAYLLLDPQQVAQSIQIDQAQIDAAYQAYVQQQPQQRQAAHILLNFTNEKEKQQAQADLLAWRDAVLAGEADFAQLAREHSQDPASARQGGDLGWILPDTLDPAFEQALFALQENSDISMPVETPFGLHLIQLLDQRAPEIKPLAEMRAQLIQDLQAQPLRERMASLSEDLRNLSFSKDSLQAVAEALQEQITLEVQTSAWISAGQAEDFWQQTQVQKVLFDPQMREDQLPSDVIKLDDERLLVIQHQAYQAQSIQDFAQVQDQVQQAWARTQAQSRLQTQAQTYLRQLQAGESLPASLSWSETQTISRFGAQTEQDLVTYIFKMPQPAQVSYGIYTDAEGNVLLLALDTVTDGEISTGDEAINAQNVLQQQAQRRWMQLQQNHYLQVTPVQRF